MRSNKINYLIVGTFVIITLIGGIASIAILSGRTGPTDAYHAYYRNVTGMKFGSQVFYEGYPIGQVNAVTPEERNARMEFRIDFDIKKDWRIPVDSIAEIGTSSLLSAVSLNISAGTSNAALKPGDLMTTKEAANIFDVVANVASEITEITDKNIKPFLEQLTRSGSLLSEILEEDGTIIIAQVRRLLDDLTLRAPGITDNIEQFTVDLEGLGDSLKRSSDQLDALLNEENRLKLEGIIDHVDRAATSMDHLMVEANVLTATASEMIESNHEDISAATDDIRHTAASVARYVDSINHHLEGASRNMYEFSRQIRQNPGLLLGGTAPKDNAEDIQ
jgi:phospholipid/cholesterol/gamma-HCH transport system substrate-binding protein